MSQKFKIIRDYYDQGEKIFPKSTIQLEPGLTILIGCNGSGKTTLLRQLKGQCHELGVPVFTYDNYNEGGHSATNYAGFTGNYERVAQDIMSSEGEKISNNINDLAAKVGAFVRKNKDAEKIFILLDAIDSGYSVDNVVELKQDFFRFVINDCAKNGIELYIVVSANEYELARGEACFDVSVCKYIEIGSYEEYRAVVIESRKKKNKRYGWAEFEYK